MLVRRPTPGWDMQFGQGRANYANDAEAVAVLVKKRLLLVFKEWFLDETEGTPYIEDVARKPANLPLAESVIKQKILDTEGVLELISFSMTFDPNIRKLYVAASVRTIYSNVQDIKVSLI